MISMLSIAADGIVFRSTTMLAFAGCVRRPSSSTSVRFAPRPRRFAVAIPGLWRGVTVIEPASLNWFWPGTNCGILLSDCSTPISDVFVSASLDNVTMGLSEL